MEKRTFTKDVIWHNRFDVKRLSDYDICFDGRIKKAFAWLYGENMLDMELTVISMAYDGFGNKMLRKNFLSAEKKVQTSTQI